MLERTICIPVRCKHYGANLQLRWLQAYHYGPREFVFDSRSPIRGGDHLPAWGPWLKVLAEGPRGQATPVYGAPGCAARSHECIGCCYCSSLLILVLCTFGKSDSKCEKGLALAIVPLINKRPSGFQRSIRLGLLIMYPPVCCG